MRKSLLAIIFAGISVPAFAADLPMKAPLYVAPAFSWTGVYVGGDIGYGWGTSEGTGTNAAGFFPVPYSFDPDGIVGGGFIGANYQFEQFIVGVEADWQAANIHGSQTVATYGGYTMDTRVNDYGSLRGRLGFAWDRWLIFATGGWAWGNGHTSYALAGAAAPYYTNSINGSSGWTVGGGAEYAITNNWLARVEYRYTDLGSHTYVDTTSNSAETGNRVTINDVRFGVAYKFW